MFILESDGGIETQAAGSFPFSAWCCTRTVSATKS